MLKPKQEIKILGLWITKDKDGKKILSGDIDHLRMVIRKHCKKTPKECDYDVYLERKL